jgi:hypothetical protein
MGHDRDSKGRQSCVYTQGESNILAVAAKILELQTFDPSRRCSADVLISVNASPRAVEQCGLSKQPPF